MKLPFITQNRHKVREAREILKRYGVEIEHIPESYIENKEHTVQEVSRIAAKELAERYGRPLIVEDTGVFFNAYKSFPGANAKLVFNSIGYKGLLKLLDGEDRSAYFLSCIGYCEPGKEPMLFEGRLDGKITDKVFDENKDVLAYERIFVPEGHETTLSAMALEQKNEISHRGKAFRKLGEFLKEQGRT